MDFSQVMPFDTHPFLAWLGRQQDWIKIEMGKSSTDEYPRSNFVVDWEKLEKSNGYEQHQRKLKALRSCNQVTLAWMAACAEALGGGPKLFFATDEQFESMTHVSIDIPIADYRQPYPAVVVKIPNETRKHWAKECGLDVNKCSQFVMLNLRETVHKTNFIFSGLTFHNEQVMYVIQDRPSFKTVEDGLHYIHYTPGTNLEEHRYAQAATRAAMNLMLLLVHYGHRVAGPTNPTDYHRHRAKKHLQKYAAGDFETIELLQNITVRRNVYRKTDGEPTGIEVSPHWRRGHWRNQAFDVQLSKRKYIFIRPMFIRADIAIGDLSDTQVTYRLPPLLGKKTKFIKP